mmetsp:Transcript_17078/g.49027  ORF Transcript_17078/g.49027 Transcript_17078/m.49027 type:complete len:335 (-) Transcript_17078:21-1025(-)
MDDSNSIEDLIRSFSASVTLMSEDAETTLGLAAVVSSAAAAATANASANNETTTSVLDELQSLEETVSDLEGQMSMLQEAVREDQVAIQELERTKALAGEQSGIIWKMLEDTQEMGVGGIGSSVGRSDVIGVGTGAVGGYAVSSSATVVTTSTGNSIETVVSADSNASNKGGVEEQKAKKQLLAQQLQLDLVTESELNSVCKNIRGRIPLAWVNDALMDILSVARRKYAVMMKYEKTGLSKLTMGNDYKRRMSLSRKHQSYLNRHYDVEVKELEGTYWVSEQDLRDTCGFFAKESSARAILLILRNLKRLKQVYGRRSMVTYILLTSETAIQQG